MNPTNEFLKGFLENLSNKKNLKTTSQFFDNMVKSQGPEFEYNILTVLFESIDWKEAIDNPNSKDNFKIDYLKKKLKQLKFEPNFVDYFGTCICECANKSIIYEKFRDILKTLKINHPFNLIFSTSFAMNTLDKRQDLLGTALLMEHLKEIPTQEKPQPLPTDFVLVLAEFLKSDDVTFKEVKDQVKLFFESYLVPLKDSKLKSLFCVGEPEMTYPDLGKETPTTDLSKIFKSSMKLFMLIKELVWNKTNFGDILRMVLKDMTSVSEVDLCECLVLMCAENIREADLSEKTPVNAKQKSSVDFALESLQFNPDDIVQTQASIKHSKDEVKTGQNEWNIDQLVQIMIETFGKKINWELVLKSISQLTLAQNSDILQNPKFYEKLFGHMESIKKSNAGKLTSDFFQLKWANSEFQFHFLFNLINQKESKSSFFGELLEKSKENIADQSNSSFNGFLQQIEQFYLNQDFMNNLFEVANQSNSNSQLKSYFETNLTKNFEGVFYVFVLLSQKSNQKLLKDLLKTALTSILNSSNNSPELVEFFYKSNKPLFIHVSSEICIGDNSCIFLSKLIDFSQNIKDFVLPLTQTDYHYFSISLSLLAIKREYLRLENWINESLESSGLPWINEFLFYIQKNFLDQVKNVTNKKVIEEIMEKNQLNKNVLAITFENYLLADKHPNVISKSAAEKIKQFYSVIQGVLPDLAQVNSVDTEKKANEILEHLYKKEITVNEFIQQIQALKNSTGNSENEILSCIVLNIIDEYRFYPNFPEPELYLTSEMYGKFIANKLIDGKAHTIFLKAISDSLEKDGRMFNFGLKSLSHFITNMELNIPIDFYKLLFQNEKLKKSHFQLLFEIRKKLAEYDREKYIDPEHLKQVTKNLEAFNKKKEEDEENEKKLKEIKKEETKAVEKNLSEILSKTFENLEKSCSITDRAKEKITYWLNGLDDKIDRHLPDFEKLLSDAGKVDWFSKYLVYKRVTSEPVVQNSYRKLIYRSQVKNLNKLVYKNSMQMINIVIDFVSSKETLLPDEKHTIRNCGKWIGLITIVCNKPILLIDLDMKKKLYECTENRTVSNVIPIVCGFIKNMEKSNLYNSKVPYINALLDILREILNLSWLNHTTKIHIELLFTEFEIQERTIHRFDYIAKRKQAESDPNNSMNNKSLMQSIKIENQLIQEYNLTDKLHVDLKLIVSMAINNSIQDIIRPVLERSVKIALETTKELILKDLAFEKDDKKFLECAKNMIQNLSWNLALVTCKDPLRSKLVEHLSHLLKIMSDLDENTRKNLKETLATSNLDYACHIVKKHVMDNSTEDLMKDEIIKAEVDARETARVQNKPFLSEYASRYMAEFPPEIISAENLAEIEKIEIYTTKYGPSTFFENSIGQNFIPSSFNEPQADHTKSADENKIIDLIKLIEKEFESPNNEDKIKQMHNLYNNLRKMLENLKNQETVIQKLTEGILTKLYFNEVNPEMLIYYVDILIRFRNHFSKLPSFVTIFIFKLPDSTLYKPEIAKLFLKNYLIEPLEFDEKMSSLMNPENILGAIFVISILKNVVIEERIFHLFYFPKIIDKIVKLSKTELINSINLEHSIFVSNLAQYVTNENAINALKLNLSNLEPEYNRLFIDMKSYFACLNEPLYNMALELIEMCQDYPSVNEFQQIFNKHNDSIKEELKLVTYFGYLFELSLNFTDPIKKVNKLQESLPLDFKVVDTLSSYIMFFLEKVPEPEISFEKILTSFIIVLTKKHFCESTSKINQRPFFRILYNFSQEIHKPSFPLKNKISDFDLIIMQTIHILQPLKYPSFAFAWLQLISNPSLMNAILKDQKKELCSQYTILIIDLMMFIRDVFTLNSKNKVEMELFYKGILKLLLILLFNYQDYLCENSFIILEEISPRFIQFRNMILSAYPKNLKMPEPFEISNQNHHNSSEFKTLPVIHSKIEYRVSSHGIQTHIINFMKTKDHKEIDKIIESFYINGYKNDKEINVSLLESFIVFVPYFIYSRLLIRIPEHAQPDDLPELQGFELFDFPGDLIRGYSR